MAFRLFKKSERDVDNERYDQEDALLPMSFDELIEGIKSGMIVKLGKEDCLTPEDFLKKDYEGKTLLEYVFEKNVNLDNDLNKRIINDASIIEECLKHKYSILLHKNGTMLLLNFGLNLDSIFMPLSNGVSLIETLLQKNRVSFYIINYINDIRIYDILTKYNRQDLYECINENVLFEPYDKYDTLFEYLLSKNMVSVKMVHNIKIHPDVIKLCKKYNKLYLLKHVNFKFLSNEFDRGLTVIEMLIKSNTADKETFYNINEEDQKIAVNAIIKYKAYRYLVYFPKVLFVRYNGKLLLDSFLENYNISMDTYLQDISYNSLSAAEMALLYIKCSDYNLLKFLTPISVDFLMEEFSGEKLINMMLKIDKDKTINQVLSEEDKNDPSIAALLKSKGVDVEPKSVPIDKYDNGNERKNKYLKIRLSKELEAKIIELKSALTMPPKSDELGIELIEASYRHLLNIGYPYAIEEIDRIIDSASGTKHFKIKKGSYPHYSSIDSTIYICDSSIGAFNHELGHALHYLTINGSTSDQLRASIEKVRNDKSCLDRVYEYSLFFKDIETEVEKRAQKIYERKYSNYFNKDRRNIINKLIEEEKATQIKQLQNYGFDASIINDIVDNLYTCSEEEFIDRFKKSKIEKIKTNILYEEYSNYGAMNDIIDAIFKGTTYSGLATASNGKKIKMSFGHGLHYYGYDKNITDEIMADFSQIIKDPKKTETITLLRNVVGDEFVDTVANFYEEEILGIERSQKRRL